MNWNGKTHKRLILKTKQKQHFGKEVCWEKENTDCGTRGTGLDPRWPPIHCVNLTLGTCELLSVTLPTYKEKMISGLNACVMSTLFDP